MICNWFNRRIHHHSITFEIYYINLNKLELIAKRLKMLQHSLLNSIIGMATTLIEMSWPTSPVYYNRSCRVCGTHLTPISLCSVCKEYVSWTCGKCLKMDDVTHRHNYCRMTYKPVKYCYGIREMNTTRSLLKKRF